MNSTWLVLIIVIILYVPIKLLIICCTYSSKVACKSVALLLICLALFTNWFCASKFLLLLSLKMNSIHNSMLPNHTYNSIPSVTSAQHTCIRVASHMALCMMHWMIHNHVFSVAHAQCIIIRVAIK